MKKKKLIKLIDSRITKASKKVLKELMKEEHFTEEQTEAVVKTVETEPTVLVEGEVYRDGYKTARLGNEHNDSYALHDAIDMDGVYYEGLQEKVWCKDVTKLTPEEEEAYLIEVAGHRGLKVGERFVSVTGKLYSEIEAFESHNGCLYRTNGGGCLYFKPDKKWATPEPVQENKVKWTTYLDSKGYTIYSSNGKIDESVCDYKITKYANEETPVIEKL